MDEAGALINSTLTTRLSPEEPVDAAYAKARDVFGRRYHTVCDIIVGKPALRVAAAEPQRPREGEQEGATPGRRAAWCGPSAWR